MAQVIDLLWSLLSSKNLTVPDHDRFLYIPVKFQERWNFPYVIGCRDGKRIRIKCLTKAGSLFYNYSFFIVLQAVADSESRFVFIDIGANGKQSDGGTFFGSTLYHFSEDFESTLTKPSSFGGSGKDVPFVILGG